MAQKKLPAGVKAVATVSSARLLAAVAHCEPQSDELRNEICGVRFDHTPNGLYVVATNGHIMAIARDTEGSYNNGKAACERTEGFTASLRPGTIQHKLLTEKGNVDKHVTVSFMRNGSAELTTVTQRISLDVPNQKFPDWRREIPNVSHDTHRPDWIAPRYWNLITKVANTMLPGVKSRHLGIQMMNALAGKKDGEAGATLVMFSELPELAVLVMGIKNMNPPDYSRWVSIGQARREYVADEKAKAEAEAAAE